MSDIFSKKLSQMINKVDDKMVQMKVNSVVDSLKKGEKEQLLEKLNKVDKTDLLEKINEFEKTKLNNIQIDKNSIKDSITEKDYANLEKALGKDGKEIVNKLKEFLK